MYLVAGALIAAGLADFSLISFHFQKNNTIAPNMVPIFYAVAMATAAISGLFFGSLFDKFGRIIALSLSFCLPVSRRSYFSAMHGSHSSE